MELPVTELVKQQLQQTTYPSHAITTLGLKAENNLLLQEQNKLLERQANLLSEIAGGIFTLID